MDLPDAAARVMALAQAGLVDDAARLAHEAVDSLAAERDPSTGEAGLWYALAVLEWVRSDGAAMRRAAERCLEQARAVGSTGWVANAHTVLAMALVRSQQVELALVELAQAELQLAACEDAGLASWAATGLGNVYQDLRLYELALPHFTSALELHADALPLAESAAIDWLNVTELHLRWADELERVVPEWAEPAQVLEHRRRAAQHAARAAQLAADDGLDAYVQHGRTYELVGLASAEPERVVEALRAVVAGPVPRAWNGDLVMAWVALARALQALGRPDEALGSAASAVAACTDDLDWHVVASARALELELRALAGDAGAAAGRAYGRMLSSLLWQQRLSTLQGARAALDVERLQRDHRDAVHRAAVDPLTGVGNRRALDLELPGRDERRRHALVLVDLDDFKQVNDTFGHHAGDQVLIAVAGALQEVARADDVVVRLGGDEFVVLAPGAGSDEASALAQRLERAVEALDWGRLTPGLRVGVSVGSATSDGPASIERLLREADAAMYAVKRGRRGGSGSPDERADAAGERTG